MARENASLRRVTVPDQNWLSSVRSLVESPDKLSHHAVLSRDWMAVPVAFDDEITDSAIERVALAVRDAHVEECVACLLEKPAGQPEYFTFPASIKGFTGFSNTRIVFRYLVTTWSLDFALLYSQEFYAVAGPEPFVTSVLGCPPAEASDRFDRYVQRWQTRHAQGYAYFADIAAHYKGIGPRDRGSGRE